MRQQTVLSAALNDELVAAHLSRLHSVQCVCTWSAAAVLSVGAILNRNISQGSVVTL